MLGIEVVAKVGQGLNKLNRKLSPRYAKYDMKASTTLETITSSNNVIAMTDDDKVIITEQLIAAVKKHQAKRAAYVLPLAPANINVNLRTKTISLNNVCSITFFRNVLDGSSWLGKNYAANNSLSANQYNLLQLSMLISRLFGVTAWSEPAKANLLIRNATIAQSTPVQNHIRELLTYFDHEIKAPTANCLTMALTYLRNPNNRQFQHRTPTFRLVDGEERLFLPNHIPGKLKTNPEAGENREYTNTDIIDLLTAKLPLMHKHSFTRKKMPTAVQAMHDIASDPCNIDAARSAITKIATICDNQSTVEGWLYGRRATTRKLYSLLAKWDRYNADAIYGQLVQFFDTYCAMAPKGQFFHDMPVMAPVGETVAPAHRHTV
jgi:archaellum component FlaF (FlaF/FlaG flagellin family)